MLTLDKLPTELIEHILIRVPLIDLLKNGRLVCKCWKKLIDCNLDLDELIILLDQTPQTSCYFNSNQVINLDNVIRTKNLKFFQIDFVRTLFRKLRRLLIFCPKATVLTRDNGFKTGHQFDIKILNCFTKLEHMEIFNLELTDHLINFFNLKVFSYKRPNTPSTHMIKVVCPQLKSFRTYGRFNYFNPSTVNPNDPLAKTGYHFYYLDRIKQLELDDFQRTIVNFKNLEILKVNQIASIDYNFLAKLQNLKEILFFSNDNIFDELHRQKRNYVLPNLCIYLLGINFEKRPCLNEIKERYSLNRENLELYISHYDLLAKHIPFVYKVDYDALKGCCSPRDLPLNFFTIFSSIRMISVKSRVEEPFEFMRFLSSINCLLQLNLMDANLDQLFYNQLPQICKSLNELIVKESRDQSIDFSPLSNLPYLIDINLNQFLTLELAQEILLNCKYLKSISFVNNSAVILILRRNSRHYESRAFGRTIVHNCLSTLIKFLKANQNI